MKYARIVNYIAADVRNDPPEGCFTSNIVAEFVAVPDEVENGWSNESGTWKAPAAPDAVEPGPASVAPPTVSPIEFMLLFTAPERVAVKAARETDPIVDDFMGIVEDPRLTGVNLALESTQNALAYLVAQNFITEDRKVEILMGVVK